MVLGRDRVKPALPNQPTMTFESYRITIRYIDGPNKEYNYEITDTATGSLIAKVDWINFNSQRQFAVRGELEVSAGYDNPPLSVELKGVMDEPKAAGAAIVL